MGWKPGMRMPAGKNAECDGSSWEQRLRSASPPHTRKSPSALRPRQSIASLSPASEPPLYGLLESLYEPVKLFWEEPFEKRYGFWRGL